MVIGVITGKTLDEFFVDIGCAQKAKLDFLRFEGATKRNKPDLKVGELVYAQVTVSNKDIEPEISCVNSKGKSAGFGVLKGGNLLNCSLSLSRSLLSRESVVLKCLGNRYPYEIAVGINGRVWINSNSNLTTFIISNVILHSEFLNQSQINQLIEKFVQESTKNASF